MLDSQSPFYLHGEDMAEGLVGPFDSVDAALDHLKIQAARGDAAASPPTFNTRVLTEAQARQTAAWSDNLVSPAKDIEIFERYR